MGDEPTTDLELRDHALVAAEVADRGLLLRSSTGHNNIALLPAPVRTSATIFLAAPPAIVSALALILIGAADHGVMAAAVLGGAAWYAARWLLPHQLRLLALMRSREGAPDAARPGTALRLRGRVRAKSSFPSAVSGQPAVMACYEIRGERAQPQRRIRGVDFEVETEKGVLVSVSAEDVFLDAPLGEATVTPRDLSVLGRPAPERARTKYGTLVPRRGALLSPHVVLYSEALLSANDEVEVSGIIVREVDPAGASDGASRTAPMRLVLRAGYSMPVFVRKL